MHTKKCIQKNVYKFFTNKKNAYKTLFPILFKWIQILSY